MARVCLILALALAVSAAEPRPGTVTMSNGETFTGMVSPIAGATLQFHDGTNLRILDFARLRELRLIPDKEEMVKHFRMPEPGKAFKEELGQPYPLRTLKAQVMLTDGETLHGHLYFTALVVEPVVAADADPAQAPPPR